MTGASDTHRRWCVRFLEGSVESQDVGAGPPGNEPGSPRRSLSGRFRRSQRKSRRAVRNIRAAPPQRRAQPCARGRVFESGRALISARGAPPPLAAASRFALGCLGSQFSVLGFLDWRRSSSRSLNCSSDSGFASASRFLTGRSCITSRTASSTIFPLFVRGMSETCTMRAGTCRGVVFCRICRRMRSSSADESATPSRRRTNRTIALVVVPQLSDHQALEHFRQLFDLTIDLRGSDPDAAGVQDCIGTPVNDQAVVFGQLDVVAVMPHAGIAIRNTPRDTSGHRGRSRTRGASREMAWCRRARLSGCGPGGRARRRPRLACRVRGLASHHATPGRSDCPPAKQLMMSVPPDIDARWMSRLTLA